MSGYFVVYRYIDPECEFMNGMPWSAPADVVARYIGEPPANGGSYRVEGWTVRTWWV